jgi:rod shape-determining protein MreB
MSRFRRRLDIAIDLGTANTVIFVRGEGIVLLEPSVIAIDERTGRVLAAGTEARRMIGRTPSTIRALRPLRHGVIADLDVTEQMLVHFLAQATGGHVGRPRVVLCVPSSLTSVEQRAVEDATRSAGARSVSLIAEPLAAAIGAGLPVGDPSASMVLDIGGGTTEVAVISLGGMVVSHSIPIAGYELDDAIVRYVRGEHGLLIGQETAERVKIALGSATDPLGDEEIEVRGRETASGFLRARQLSAVAVRDAIRTPVARIVQAVVDTLERTPPELAADLTMSGIVLAGGGAMLHHLGERLEDEAAIPARLADEPLTCVASGAGQTLEELDLLRAE